MCILESERLILRPPGPRDIQSITVWLGDYDVARMTSRVPHPYNEDDAEAFLALLHHLGEEVNQAGIGREKRVMPVRAAVDVLVLDCRIHQARR